MIFFKHCMKPTPKCSLSVILMCDIAHPYMLTFQKHFQILYLDQMGLEISELSHKWWWTTVFRWGGQTHCPVAPFHRPQGKEGACSTCFPSYWPTQLYLPSLSTQDYNLGEMCTVTN